MASASAARRQRGDGAAALSQGDPGRTIQWHIEATVATAARTGRGAAPHGWGAQAKGYGWPAAPNPRPPPPTPMEAKIGGRGQAASACPVTRAFNTQQVQAGLPGGGEHEGNGRRQHQSWDALPYHAASLP